MIEMGTRVSWDSGQQKGYVADVFNRKVTWRLQGGDIQCHETSKHPTYLIELENGEFILKQKHELAILH